MQGEDLETCARNAGFELPADAVAAKTTSPGLPNTEPLSEHEALRLFGNSPNASTAGSRNGLGDTVSPGTTVQSDAYVQVSVAMKQQWTLAWAATGMAAVGLFMISS